MRRVAAALADFCCVLLFVLIGRANHHAGGGLAGLGGTLWPFAAGTAAGLLVTRFWRRPAALLPTGVGVWLCTVAIGMILRVVSGQGTAVAFIGVALAFLGLFQLGWRVVAQWIARARPSRPLPAPGAQSPGAAARGPAAPAVEPAVPSNATHPPSDS